MSRNKYVHLPLTCHRGINQQRGKATLDECAEALNVWAPDGVVEQRPGFVGVTSFPFFSVTGKTYQNRTKTLVEYDPTGPTYATKTHGQTLYLSNHAINHFWYIGVDQVEGTYQEIITDNDFTGTRRIIGIDVDANLPNANDMRYEASYWNGTEFVPLRVIERDGKITDTTYGEVRGTHLAQADFPLFCFCPPGDWASSTINSVEAFYIQFKLKPVDGSTALDASTTLVNGAADFHHISAEVNQIRGLFAGEFPSTKRYIAVSNFDYTGTTGNSVPMRIRWMMGKDPEFRELVLPDYEILDYDDDCPATHAIVPQFGEGFIAYGDRIKRYSIREDWPQAGSGTDQMATDAVRETADFAVGPEAPYSAEYATLREFPMGKYITFFQGRLWVAGTKDEPFTIRWSVTQPYHKVWFMDANNHLMEDDNSPITGIAGLGEHLIAFKRDSIWAMVEVGRIPGSEISDYRGMKIVDGVGCVSHHSIQQVRGKLVFLGEDGIYAFDGTANIQKISDRIDTTVKSINQNRAAFAVSANWKTRGCYLLSVPAGQSYDNSKTLVYDYLNDAWWIWNIAASFWLNDENSNDEETLYFTDNFACIHEMGVGNTDHGQAITSTLVTQRIGETDNVRRTVRQVEVVTDNRTESLTVAVRANDDSNGDVSGTLSLNDDAEAKYASNLLFAASTNYVLDRNRARRLSFRQQGDWVQVFVSHNTHNTPMSIRAIDIGITGAARR